MMYLARLAPAGEQRVEPSDDRTYSIQELFQPSEHTPSRLIESRQFARTKLEFSTRAELILDEFPDVPGAACCSLRTAYAQPHRTRLVFWGDCKLQSCPSGGWLLTPAAARSPSYWVPLPPVARTVDARGRILSEQPAALAGFDLSPAGAILDIDVPGNVHLDWVVWRLPSEAPDLSAGLARPLTLEMQSICMWGSHTAFRGPADVYRYLIHEHVYENRFEWRRKWKVCAENEAYSLYVALQGLELASRKRLYGLLARQIIFSVVSRQAEDGGWYHGEWSDFMESHYRLHNAAVLLLAAALEQDADDLIGTTLTKGAAYTARHTDQTRLGLWFLHDSLEENLELLQRSGSRLVPSRVLGKSPGNAMVLNTHLDAIVALERYRDVTGDNQYAEKVASALGSTRALLALRPANLLYRIIYWAVWLTLVAPTEAARLPLILRVIKRLSREHLLPRLHRIKQQYPRMVMPGGLIERHLSVPEYDVDYQAVNTMDLARVLRRFPGESFRDVINGAVRAVRETTLLRYWVESKKRQGLSYWPSALYELCMLDPAPEYRRYLGEAILSAEELGLGLPPSLLGANPEVVSPRHRTPCPSPEDTHLRVANLSRGARREILVVNCSASPVGLTWDQPARDSLVWQSADGQTISEIASPLSVPARSWVLGVSPNSYGT